MSSLPGTPTILYINHEKWAGGATVHRDEFVSAARAQGANLILYPDPQAVTGGDGGYGLRQRFKQWLYRRWTDVALLLIMAKHAPGEGLALFRTRPDVLLINYTFHISSILLGRVLGIPVVLQIHCPYYLHARYANERLRLLFFWKWLERRAIGLASAVVVVSDTLRDYYVDIGFPRHKFAVVPNGVDLSRFDPHLRGEAVRERFDLQGSLVIGFVGVLVAWSGIDWFLEALPRLGSLLEKVVVLIIGWGGLEPRLRQIVAKSGLEERVRFAGFVPHAEVPEYVASFDIAVAPYRKVELFYNSPMKLYEYMAMGKPIVTPRMGQSARLIKHGETGLLYEPDDEEGMLKLFELLIQDADLRACLGRAAQERSREMAWTWERNAAAILDVCRLAAASPMERTIPSRSQS